MRSVALLYLQPHLAAAAQPSSARPSHLSLLSGPPLPPPAPPFPPPAPPLPLSAPPRRAPAPPRPSPAAFSGPGVLKTGVAPYHPHLLRTLVFSAPRLPLPAPPSSPSLLSRLLLSSRPLRSLTPPPALRPAASAPSRRRVWPDTASKDGRSALLPLSAAGV